MAVTYCTATQVASLAGLTVSAGSDPTTTEVEEMVNHAEGKIERATGHAWQATATVTDEYHDIKRRYVRGTGVAIYLKHRTIGDFTSGTHKIEIWDGDDWVDWALTANSKTNARDGDYWIDQTQGVIYLRSGFRWGKKTARITYRYGESTIPEDIEEACAKLAAIELLRSKRFIVTTTDLTPEGGTMNLSTLLDGWAEDVKEILRNRKEVKVL